MAWTMFIVDIINTIILYWQVVFNLIEQSITKEKETDKQQKGKEN